MKRYLIVTKNEFFINNMLNWFEKEIKNKEMEIDFAKTREEAEELLKNKPYDKIFHNGMYVIDLIEKYQSNVDVVKEGSTKNKIYSKTVSGKNKKEILGLDRSNPVYLKMSLGWVVSVIAIIMAATSYIVGIRSDVNVNKIDLVQLKNKVEKIDYQVGMIRTDVNKMLYYFEKYFENNKNKGDGE